MASCHNGHNNGLNLQPLSSMVALKKLSFRGIVITCEENIALLRSMRHSETLCVQMNDASWAELVKPGHSLFQLQEINRPGFLSSQRNMDLLANLPSLTKVVTPEMECSHM